MARIQSTGKQFTITISPDLVKRMGWKKGTEVVISKIIDKDMLYIEEIKKRRRQ